MTTCASEKPGNVKRVNVVHVMVTAGSSHMTGGQDETCLALFLAHAMMMLVQIISVSGYFNLIKYFENV